MTEAYICDAVRTPIGRYAGALATVRADDLGAVPIKALVQRNVFDWEAVDDVIYGCANQAGEDNRNVGRMSLLLAGLPHTVAGSTVNRLCGSGMDAVSIAARAIKVGEVDLVIAGGVESMSRAPLVMSKAEMAFARKVEVYDSTIGWRFVNPLLEAQYGVDSMPETAENVAEAFHVKREDQDKFALRSQKRAAAAKGRGFFKQEIVPVMVPRRKADPIMVSEDEHPRPDTSLVALSKLPTPFKDNGTVTAGNSSGVNDGACALIVASEAAVKRHGLSPKARVLGSAVAGVEPNIMGVGPTPATMKLLGHLEMTIQDFDVIELNEAFAAQSLAVIRQLTLPDNAEHVNPNGGAIALGHPLGMSGARLVTTAMYQLHDIQGRYALCTMCIGVGQGMAMVIERI